MLKVKVRWGGFLGSPGWTNFYFDSGTGDFTTPEQAGPCADKVAAWITAIKPNLPPAVTLTIQSDVEAVSAATGELLTIHSAGARAAVNGTATAQGYAAATGLVTTWRTAGVRNGRRVRGRTFIVPCVGGTFDTDGTVQPTKLTPVVDAANALLAPFSGISLGVWSRPSGPGASDGQFFPAISASVPDMAAVLRSRRD
jgi:hypothetical protein